MLGDVEKLREFLDRENMELYVQENFGVHDIMLFCHDTLMEYCLGIYFKGDTDVGELNKSE